MGHFNVAVFVQHDHSETREIVMDLLRPYWDIIPGESAYEWDYNPNAKYDWYMSDFQFVDINQFDNIHYAVLPSGEWVDLWDEKEKHLEIKEKAINERWYMVCVDCHC